MSTYPGLRERAAAIVERRRVEVADALSPEARERMPLPPGEWMRSRPAAGVEFEGPVRTRMWGYAFPVLPRVAVLAVWWGSGCAPVPEASALWWGSSGVIVELFAFSAGRAPRVGGGWVWLRSGVLVAAGEHPRQREAAILGELRALSAHVGAVGWGDVVEVDTTD